MTESDRSGRDGFLARWSERKRAVRDTEEAEEQAEAKRQEEAADEGEDEAALAANRAAAEAVDLEGLTVGSDMSPFFKPGVPALLKQAALRKLWRCNPVFACQDGLDIYRENFHDPSYLLKGGASSWIPGSGYAQRLAELKEQAKKALAEAKARAGEAAPDTAAAEPADAASAGDAGESPAAEAQDAPAAETPKPAELAESADAAEPAEAADEAPEAEDAEPAPRVPLRARLDLAAFKDEG